MLEDRSTEGRVEELRRYLLLKREEEEVRGGGDL